MADLNPYIEEHRALIIRIDEHALSHDEFSDPKPGKLAIDACNKFMDHFAMIQAERRKDGPAKFTNEGLRLAIGDLTQHSSNQNDPYDKAIIVLKRELQP